MTIPQPSMVTHHAMTFANSMTDGASLRLRQGAEDKDQSPKERGGKRDVLEGDSTRFTHTTQAAAAGALVGALAERGAPSRVSQAGTQTGPWSANISCALLPPDNIPIKRWANRWHSAW